MLPTALELCRASEGKTADAQGRYTDAAVEAAPEFCLGADHLHGGERFQDALREAKVFRRPLDLALLDPESSIASHTG